uniref:Uncharacterized protein n=1 Tax=Pristionchus pacificus TaxID=54126 RepID=A0A2A6C7I2_PRIPA|eukprot:PDM74134.1 hypothetical protein PRIPAC_41490 [Pristionchus pacificus]
MELRIVNITNEQSQQLEGYQPTDMGKEEILSSKSRLLVRLARARGVSPAPDCTPASTPERKRLGMSVGEGVHVDAVRQEHAHHLCDAFSALIKGKREKKL